MRNVVAVLAISLLAGACSQQAPPHADPSSTSASPTNEVLTISDREATPGQIVEVSFEPPPEHEVWGVDGELWRERDGEWKRIAWTSGWARKPKMGTAWPTDELSAFPDVGFRGSASWRWKVPARLEPGNYELRKEWRPKAPASADRPVVTERALFTVVAG